MPKAISKTWQTRADQAVMQGVTDHPSRQAPDPLVITRGTGPFVIDTDGRKYFDANSGLGNTFAGYDQDALGKAAQDQFSSFGAYHTASGRVSDQAVLLAEKLIEISPFGTGKVFFSNSGADANDTMVKMLWFMNKMRGMPTKRKIITLNGSTHGATAVSASMTGQTAREMFGLPLPEFVHVRCPHFWREALRGETEDEFTQRMAQELDQAIRREGAQTVAGFFAEPVIGSAGAVITPPKGYFQAIAKVLGDHRIPLIVDESVTGLGRTGQVWGADTMGFTPDAIIASDTLTAGYFPMGAVILGPELAQMLQGVADAYDGLPHTFTTGGHPVGCAVALKTIEMVTTGGLIDAVAALTPKFQAGLKKLAKIDVIGDCRSIGLLGALELIQAKDSKAPFDDNLQVAKRIEMACLDNGLICRTAGNAITLCPPFVMTKSQMDDMFRTLDAAIKQVVSELN